MKKMNNGASCCFIGHRKINDTDRIRKRLYDIIESLIIERNVATFFFGSRSEFDKLCYELVETFKEKYPYIIRIYVRAEYPDIGEDYRKYLLESYEETYYPKCAKRSGKAVYIKRNFEMINRSDFCVFYYIKNIRRNSGTKIALEHALKNNNTVINVADINEKTD